MFARFAYGGFLAALLQLPGTTFSQEILIGQTIALTGSTAEHGKAEMQGAQAYIGQVNQAGGIRGKKVKIKILDDAGDGKRAAENTTTLINEGVIAIFSGIEGGPCGASLKVALERKVPIVACAAGSPELRGTNRYLFPVRAAHYDEFVKLIDFSVTFGRKRIAFLHADSDTGRQHRDNVIRIAKARGIEEVLAIPFIGSGDKASDPGKIAQQIIDAKIETVFNHGSYGYYAKVIKEAMQRGAPISKFMAVNSGAQQMNKLLGENGRGLIFTQVVPYPWSYTNIFPVVTEYRDAWTKAFPGEEISFSGLEGFMNAKALVEGLRRIKGEANSESLVLALQSMRHYDLGGVTIDFSASEGRGSKFVDIVISSSKGRFVH